MTVTYPSSGRGAFGFANSRRRTRLERDEGRSGPHDDVIEALAPDLLDRPCGVGMVGDTYALTFNLPGFNVLKRDGIAAWAPLRRSL